MFMFNGIKIYITMNSKLIAQIILTARLSYYCVAMSG